MTALQSTWVSDKSPERDGGTRIAKYRRRNLIHLSSSNQNVKMGGIQWMEISGYYYDYDYEGYYYDQHVLCS